MYKTDTSSDQITLHMFAYSIFHDLGCDTDDERARVVRLVRDTVSYIMNNNYTLIDPTTGKHTTWGMWNPLELNGDHAWMEERGLNSMQMMSWLMLAYRLTNDPQYLNAYNTLAPDYIYDINTDMELISAPVVGAHSQCVRCFC